MWAPYFPEWRGVYRSEHLLGILCTSRNMFSGYIPEMMCNLITYLCFLKKWGCKVLNLLKTICAWEQVMLEFCLQHDQIYKWKVL